MLSVKFPVAVVCVNSLIPMQAPPQLFIIPCMRTRLSEKGTNINHKLYVSSIRQLMGDWWKLGNCIHFRKFTQTVDKWLSTR